MHSIFIDTTDRYQKSVKLIKDGKDLDFVSGDIDIISSIAQLLKNHNLKVSDITSFDCNPGPGSFTGIKVGITIVNVLNWALGNKTPDVFTRPVYGRPPNITPRKKK